MSDEVLMTLGTIRFSVALGAFQSLEREMEIRVAKQDRSNGATARQILGFDETIKISGVIYPDRTGTLGRMQSFRDLAAQRLPQLLTDGMGNVWGLYVIEKVTEKASVFLPNGAAMKQEFTLDLGAYGADA